MSHQSLYGTEPAKRLACLNAALAAVAADPSEEGRLAYLKVAADTPEYGWTEAAFTRFDEVGETADLIATVRSVRFKAMPGAKVIAERLLAMMERASS